MGRREYVLDYITPPINWSSLPKEDTSFFLYIFFAHFSSIFTCVTKGGEIILCLFATLSLNPYMWKSRWHLLWKRLILSHHEKGGFEALYIIKNIEWLRFSTCNPLVTFCF